VRSAQDSRVPEQEGRPPEPVWRKALGHKAEALRTGVLLGDSSLWHLDEPSVLISVAGGEEDLSESVADALGEGLLQACSASSAWVTTTALDTPVNATIGRALAHNRDTVLIGITPLRSVASREALEKIPKGYSDVYVYTIHRHPTRHTTSSYAHSSSVYVTPRELEMNHTHLLLTFSSSTQARGRTTRAPSYSPTRCVASSRSACAPTIRIRTRSRCR